MDRPPAARPEAQLRVWLMWDCDSLMSVHATEVGARAARDAHIKRRDILERFADQIIVSARPVEP